MRVRPTVVVWASMLLFGCTDPGPREPGAATVVAVIDGDTVELAFGGRRERVRLIGIDTPETKHPDRPVECFGPEASAFTAALLPPGTSVVVQRDVEPRDDYGRLLAYVVRRADGVAVNVTIARQGFARVLSIPPNIAQRQPIADAVRAARTERLGLWGACIGGPAVPATGDGHG